MATARRTLASVAERAAQHGYWSGARTDIINAHADKRAALNLRVMAAAGDDGSVAGPCGLLADGGSVLRLRS